jgi:predicted nucleic acid-binding protein
MKHLFIDANVVIDLLADREPFSSVAAELFDSSVSGNTKLYVSAVSFNVVYFILRKEYGHKGTLDVMRQLADMVVILDVTSPIMHKAIHSGFADFEDAIQYFVAVSEPKIDAIITRDVKGFRKSELPVMRPDEALAILRK